MKVAKNREEPFKKKGSTTTYYQEDTTYYVWNTDDNRSRKDNWKPKSYVRSDSRPGFFRTASRNTYVRDNSRFRKGSNIRHGSQSGGKFTGPRNNSKQGVRNPSKSLERPKSEMFKKVETLAKDMKEIKEMLKASL